MTGRLALTIAIAVPREPARVMFVTVIVLELVCVIWLISA